MIKCILAACICLSLAGCSTDRGGRFDGAYGGISGGGNKATP